jgi:branched-chain amino acid transport system permease protein
MNYFVHTLTVINIYVILALSLNLLVGYLGIISLGQASFFAVGAYTYALIVVRFDCGFILGLVFSIGLTILLGVSFSAYALRLRSDYIILATLAFQLIIYDVLYNWVQVTRGPFGISGIPSPDIGSVRFDSTITFFLLTSIFVLFTIVLLYFLTASPFGRVLRSIRDDELATMLLGKNTMHFKVISFGISAGLAGMAGALLSGFMTYIDPTTFTLNESVFILSIVIIGSSERFSGPIVGTILMIAIPELLRFLDVPDSVAANARNIIQSVIVLLVLRFKPSNILFWEN